MTTPYDGAQSLIDDLLFAQRSLTAFQKLMQEGERYAPESAEGTDPSGQVKVFLNSKGAPNSIRVNAGWQQRLRPDALGGAVVEAARVALAQRADAWSEQLDRSDWQTRVARLEQRLERNLRADDSGLPPAFQRLAGGQEPRPLTMLTEEMLKLFDRVDDFTVPERVPESAGRNRNRRISLTLAGGAGITGCEVDAAWAAGQSGNDLTAALREALDAALAEAAARPDPESPAAGVDGLIAETVALLDGLPFNLR